MILALIVVAFVTAFAIAMLQVSGAVTQRQVNAVNDKRAFYLAEAGLAEAYYGLQTGKSGTIGSLQAPALLGDGLVWVESVWGDRGIVTLRSTGLCETGRSTLELVVRRDTRSFGVFARQAVDLAVPFLVDGYDSESSTYYEQAGLGKLVPAEDPNVLFAFWHAMDAVLQVHYAPGTPLAGVKYYYCDEHDFATGEFFYTHRTDGLLKLRSALTEADAVAGLYAHSAGGGPAAFDDVTTGAGGQIGSNGAITLAGDGVDGVAVWGDLAPGAGASAAFGSDVLVSGSVQARSENVALPAVVAPAVTMLPGVTHGSAIPYVVPPGNVGYDYLRVGTNSELVLQGPAQLVVGELELASGARLDVQNQTGTIDLYVTGALDFQNGSEVQVGSRDTSKLSVQATPDVLRVDLLAGSQFHGMVYAPDSELRVGSDFELFGMLAADQLLIDPHARLHFDSGVLNDSGSVPVPKLVGWSIEEIPGEVAQSRADPFELLALEREDLVHVSEAQQTTSWILECTYEHEGRIHTFEGPIEQYPNPYNEFFTTAATLTRPDVSFETPWTIDIHWRDWSSSPHHFVGTMEEFQTSVLPSLSRFREAWSVTPPVELQ